QGLERAANLDASNGDIAFDLALVLLSDGQYEAAATQLEKSIKIRPSNHLAPVLFRRALLNTNRSQHAIQEYEKELSASGEHPELLYQLGRCRLEAGDWGVAVTHLQRAVELNPQNS